MAFVFALQLLLSLFIFYPSFKSNHLEGRRGVIIRMAFGGDVCAVHMRVYQSLRLSESNAQPLLIHLHLFYLQKRLARGTCQQPSTESVTLSK